MNFGQLKSRLLALIGRAPNDLCYELVTADINQRLRVREMEAQATIAASATVALPADFIQVQSIYLDGNPPTTLYPIVPGAKAVITQGASGLPVFYEVIDGSLRLEPVPNGTNNLILRYYAKVPDLVLDGDTTRVLNKFPAVYVYGTLAHHAALIRDEKAVAIHYAAFEKAVMQANAEDRRAKVSGLPSSPVVRSA